MEEHAFPMEYRLNCGDLLKPVQDFPRSGSEDYTQWQNHDTSRQYHTATREYYGYTIGELNGKYAKMHRLGNDVHAPTASGV